MEKLNEDFFVKDAITLARDLVGKYIVRVINGEKIIVKITETEAYDGKIDKACHAYGGKLTNRTKVFLYKRFYYICLFNIWYVLLL